MNKERLKQNQEEAKIKFPNIKNCGMYQCFDVDGEFVTVPIDVMNVIVKVSVVAESKPMLVHALVETEKLSVTAATKLVDYVAFTLDGVINLDKGEESEKH